MFPHRHGATLIHGIHGPLGDGPSMVHHTGTAAYLTRVRNPRVPNGYQSRALVDTTASVTAGVGSSMEILSGEGQQPSSERQPEQETAQRSRSTSMVVSLIDIQSAVAAEHFLCAIHCGHPEVMTKEFLAIVDGSMNAVLQDGGQGFWDFAGYRFRKPARLGIEYGGLSTVIIGTQIAATAIPILGFVFGAVAFGGIAVTAWKQNSSGKRSQEEIFEERYKFPLFRLLKGKAWWAPRRACPRALPAARVFLSAFAFFSWLALIPREVARRAMSDRSDCPRAGRPTFGISRRGTLGSTWCSSASGARCGRPTRRTDSSSGCCCASSRCRTTRRASRWGALRARAPLTSCQKRGHASSWKRRLHDGYMTVTCVLLEEAAAR